MTVPWKSWPNLFCVCLSLCATRAMSENFWLEPNSTVLRGSDAQFNATVVGNWPVMAWMVGENLVLTISSSNETTAFTDRFSARFCSGHDPSCVEFTIHNVTREDSGPVSCSVQGTFGMKTVWLKVQESGTVDIVGGNVTLVQDQQVEFQCVTSAWYPRPTISWTLDGEAVNSSLYNTTSMADGDVFNSTSVLYFQAVRSTTVECLASVEALTKPQSSSFFVVVVPKPTDWTVLIAVVVSFGGFALLVLLIIGIIFCYKRRKEKQPNYQDEMSRRVRTQSEISGAAGQRRGHTNSAYMPDGQTSVAPSEVTDSGFSQANGSNVLEMPDIVNSNQAENDYRSAYDTLDEPGPRKHRHVTIV